MQEMKSIILLKIKNVLTKYNISDTLFSSNQPGFSAISTGAVQPLAENQAL